MWAHRITRHVFFLALVLCLAWVLCATVLFHTYLPRSKSIHVVSKTPLLPPLTLRKKYAVLSPALSRIDHLREKRFDETTTTASEYHVIGEHFKRSSGAKVGTHVRQAGNINDDPSVGFENKAQHQSLGFEKKAQFYNFSETVIQAVSRMRIVPSEQYLVYNQSFFTPRKAVVNHFHTHWLIQTTCPPAALFLLIIVPSPYSHKGQRRAIRETWGSVAHGHAWPGTLKLRYDSVKVVFFLGVSKKYDHEQLLYEAEEFRDIVVGDFVDSYKNLSLKMAMVLQWVGVFCARTQYVLKVDEDTFVNLPILQDALSLFSANNSHFVMGHKKARAKPNVVHWGRWKVDKNVYPLQYYPQYLYGHSYVISGDAIRSLRHVSHHLPLVPNEDAYVTGVLAKSAGVQRVHSWRFAIVGRRYRRCRLVNGTHISQTAFSPSELHVMWDQFKAAQCAERV
ncbi:hypothetical protein ACOMHN_060425 [Nucella lapillus]